MSAPLSMLSFHCTFIAPRPFPHDVSPWCKMTECAFSFFHPPTGVKCVVRHTARSQYYSFFSHISVIQTIMFISNTTHGLSRIHNRNIMSRKLILPGWRIVKYHYHSKSKQREHQRIKTEKKSREKEMKTKWEERQQRKSNESFRVKIHSGVKEEIDKRNEMGRIVNTLKWKCFISFHDTLLFSLLNSDAWRHFVIKKQTKHFRYSSFFSANLMHAYEKQPWTRKVERFYVFL